MKTGIYFYNGFNAPKKVAENVEDLMALLIDHDVAISDTYQGNKNTEIIEEIRSTKDDEIDDLLADYDMYVNPSIQVFQKKNIESYGLDKNAHLDMWERGL